MVKEKTRYPLRLKIIVAPLVFFAAVLMGNASGAPALGVVLGIVAAVTVLNAMR